MSKIKHTKKMRTGKCWLDRGDFDHLGSGGGSGGSSHQETSRFRMQEKLLASGEKYGPSTSKKSKMMQTKKMCNGKCWFEKGDFHHFGMCFGCFRTHFGPGKTLK